MSSEEVVTSSAQILDCLNEISKSGKPVQLSVSGEVDGRIYESRFHSVLPQKRQILLRQVLPGNWRESVTPQTKLEIRSCTKLGHIRFKGFLSSLDNSGINPYCILTLPARIYRKQDRNYFRVSLTRISNKASLQLDAATTLVGRCHDCSMAGAQLVLPEKVSGVAIGQMIEQCALVIDEEFELRCRGKICSLQARDREIIAGIQFTDLTAAQRRQIASALNRIERQNINS